MIEVSLKMHHPYFVHATNIYFLCILFVYFFLPYTKVTDIKGYCHSTAKKPK